MPSFPTLPSVSTCCKSSHHGWKHLRVPSLSLRLVLGEPWTRDVDIPQGCPLNMVFTVAPYVPWCRYLADQVGVLPPPLPSLQQFADNLKCTTSDDRALLLAARFTHRYIRAVGQEASLGMSVLLSTSKATRRRMTYWAIPSEARSWAVKLDIQDLGVIWVLPRI